MFFSHNPVSINAWNLPFFICEHSIITDSGIWVFSGAQCVGGLDGFIFLLNKLKHIANIFHALQWNRVFMAGSATFISPALFFS